jgi:hypothetical protein
LNNSFVSYIIGGRSRKKYPGFTLLNIYEAVFAEMTIKIKGFTQTIFRQND